MNEILLTTEEIKKINSDASTSLLNIPGVFGKFTKKKTDILSLSPINRLIFIQGDSFTGITHINLRHRYYTNSFSKTKDNRFAPTSKFEKESGKLFDYHKISDKLYSSHNTDLDNYRPDIFEIYKSKVDDIEYKMILYKDTKIIHTIFPIQRKKDFKKFEKGDIITQQIDFRTYIGVIPYFDSSHVIKYGIGIKCNTFEENEEWFIFIYENGKPVNQINIGMLEIKYQYDIGTRFQQINFEDVTKYEEVIDKIEKGEIK
jgi:hypothetical protein